MSAPALQRIAGWSSTLTLEAVPDEVRGVARACFIDTLGVALAGSRTEVARRAQAVATVVGAPGACAVLGADARLAAPSAAFANATAAHALDFDDNCYAGVVHGSAVIVPAAFAMAQAVNASGAELLTAFIAGSEAEYALGSAATMSLYDRGWWTTGVLGPIGAAAAAARLLGLTANATASALGIALAGTGGAKAAFGTDAKPLLAGRAAEAGIIAALLAANGASGPHDAAEHKRGFAGLFNGGVFDPVAFGSLGTQWRLLDPGIDIKRIPVCLSSHAAVDAVVELVARNGVPLNDIVSIVCDVPPIVIANLIHDRPATKQQAQFSMPFAVAVSLRFGDLTLAHLDDALVNDPALVALMAKVEMVTGPTWDDPAALRAAPEGAYVRLELRDGTVLTGYRAFPRGAAASPLSAAEIDAKFLGCTAHVPDADALLLRLHALETLPALRDLIASPVQETL
ncbi:MAG TPA: MmgE/PrpD family protein [Ancylobacter sp.]